MQLDALDGPETELQLVALSFCDPSEVQLGAQMLGAGRIIAELVAQGSIRAQIHG